MSIIRTLSAAAPPALTAIAQTIGNLPRNDFLWSYTIRGRDDSPYLTRLLGPRVRGWRPLAHQIWRPDAERHCHNHPWREARFLVVSGGYLERRRLASGEIVTRRLCVGDVNVLLAEDYHQIVEVSPDTCTLGLVGDRCQGWGFWVDDEGFVPKDVYLARQGYGAQEGLGL